VQGGVEGNGIAQPAGAVELAQGVGPRGRASTVIRGGEGADNGAPHGNEGGGGVDGEEDVVHDDEIFEGLGSGDGPGTVRVRPVVRVSRRDGEDVDGGEQTRHFPAEAGMEEGRRDRERPVRGWGEGGGERGWPWRVDGWRSDVDLGHDACCSSFSIPLVPVEDLVGWMFR